MGTNRAQRAHQALSCRYGKRLPYLVIIKYLRYRNFQRSIHPHGLGYSRTDGKSMIGNADQVGVANTPPLDIHCAISYLEKCYSSGSGVSDLISMKETAIVTLCIMICPTRTDTVLLLFGRHDSQSLPAAASLSGSRNASFG